MAQPHPNPKPTGSRGSSIVAWLMVVSGGQATEIHIEIRP